jgi:hypothetical protein
MTLTFLTIPTITAMDYSDYFMTFGPGHTYPDYRPIPEDCKSLTWTISKAIGPCGLDRTRSC